MTPTELLRDHKFFLVLTFTLLLVAGTVAQVLAEDVALQLAGQPLTARVVLAEVIQTRYDKGKAYYTNQIVYELPPAPGAAQGQRVRDVTYGELLVATGEDVPVRVSADGSRIASQLEIRKHLMEVGLFLAISTALYLIAAFFLLRERLFVKRKFPEV